MKDEHAKWCFQEVGWLMARKRALFRMTNVRRMLGTTEFSEKEVGALRHTVEPTEDPFLAPVTYRVERKLQIASPAPSRP